MDHLWVNPAGGGGALKGSLGRGVKTKIAHFATLSKTGDTTF